MAKSEAGEPSIPTSTVIYLGTDRIVARVHSLCVITNVPGSQTEIYWDHDALIEVHL